MPEDPVPLLLKTLSLIFYLDDVSADGHTFSIVPEGIETKRGLPGVGTEEGEASWRGTELNPALEGTSHVPAGIDIAAKAGSAILFHTGSLHAGTVRQTDELRRTIHIYYGHEGLPALSEHMTAIPRRLSDPKPTVAALPEGMSLQETRRFYGRKNKITQLFREEVS